MCKLALEPRPGRRLTATFDSVNPIYYVFFSTATILASLIMFRGLNTSGGVNTISLICGFLTTFLGVYLLNLSRSINSSTSLNDNGPLHHRRRASHSLLESGMLNPRISISSDRPQGATGRASFDSLPTDEDEAYPLRTKHHNQPRRSGSGQYSPGGGQKRESISSYNHQGQNGGYAAVNGTDASRRQSPPEIVFDIGNEDDDEDGNHLKSPRGR